MVARLVQFVAPEYDMMVSCAIKGHHFPCDLCLRESAMKEGVQWYEDGTRGD